MAAGPMKPAGGGGGSSRRRSRRPRAPMSEINVTPFVDVMLVLLIVFMVAAPLLTVGVPIDLPQTKSQPLQEDTEPLTVTVNADGEIYLQETVVEIDELSSRLLAIAKGGYEERVYVRGDKNVAYGDIMQVMGTLSSAGFRRIGMVTEQSAPDSADKR
ncbi:protein TolR [Pyruvatibacter mobilis]|jgi:biopolymer transport protein TolR|uniref:Tol-Pal system protein TolR n=1 Tax=Pyruvatibacter mobilis TaxID=1712261 RepID=A0A845QEP9_9HYPH|nr:protein TolR [Pyruvatibacter mobilis]NBG96716.1 protein TolR [Pyruvatibacter mobilis]QJD74288.1 protein TolR [Pyruvatibacter mobilis]GGD05607.1 protein TolR [Pyruvatibacter mobilis]